MNKGRFYITLLLVEPLKQTFMEIPRAVIIDCEGFANSNGYTYTFSDGGLINFS